MNVEDKKESSWHCKVQIMEFSWYCKSMLFFFSKDYDAHLQELNLWLYDICSGEDVPTRNANAEPNTNSNSNHNPTPKLVS